VATATATRFERDKRDRHPNRQKARNSVSIVAHFIGGLTDVCCLIILKCWPILEVKEILNCFKWSCLVHATVELLERFGDFL
jgi:hypothetical protein